LALSFPVLGAYRQSMRTIKHLPGAVWRKVRALFSLIHNWDDVRETYGDNPNNLPEEQRLAAHAVASNTINVGQSGW